MCTCPIPAGTRASHCAACCTTFTSLTGFDRHQHFGPDGRVVCTPPADCGLVPYTRGGLEAWGLPPDPDSRLRYSRETAEQGSPGVPGRPEGVEAL